ncbi:MAG: stage II sporulation protein M [Caulobacter sp.]|nr:stage II sporulation protein M [Caulobacter sp.]
MAPLQLKSQKFREEREEDWRRLSFLLDKVEGGGAKSLTDVQLMAVPVLYRSALSSLSVARATSLDQSLVEYLEGLCARAYFLVYGARARLGERILRFFTHGWPAAVRSIWKETLAAALIVGLSVVVGYVLVRQNPDWYYAIVGSDMASGRDPTASAEFLRKSLYDGGKDQSLAMFAAFLFNNNARVALFAFALGFAFALPTALLLIQNGAGMGAMIAVFAAKDLGWQFGGWLFIHGTTELFAIIIAGGAGFRIGLAVAFPGDRTRLDAAATAGRQTGAAMAGVVLMLLIAGLLEGFGRQLITSDLARYGVGAAAAALWLSYFYLPRREGARRERV